MTHEDPDRPDPARKPTGPTATAKVAIYVPVENYLPPDLLQEVAGRAAQIHVERHHPHFSRFRADFYDATVVINAGRIHGDEFTRHLEALCRFVRRHATHLEERELEQLTDRILATRQLFGCTIEPGFDPGPEVAPFLFGVAQAGNGLLFSHDCLFAPTGELLVQMEGGSPPEFLDVLRASQESLARKNRSEAILEVEKVPFNPSLPAIEDESQATFRLEEEVAGRAMALCAAALKGEGLEPEQLEDFIADRGIRPFFSPRELEFIDEPEPTEQDCIQFSWRHEGFWTLLWALGYLPELGRPDALCDPSVAVEILNGFGGSRFIQESHLRPRKEILDEADLIYRYHWAVQRARRKDELPPTGLDPGVVYERHYALNWIIGYLIQSWDDVSTDT